MIISKFGENEKLKWYEDNNGKRTYCSENTIDFLWQKWIMYKCAKREDTTKYTIFAFYPDIEINETEMNNHISLCIKNNSK